MSACGKEILINREGSDKHHRFPEALNPDLVRLNDFGLGDWMRFAIRFAEKINFFETINSDVPSGNWQEMFIKDNEINDFLISVSKGKTIPSHLALFVSFISLLQYTQKRFNLLTRKHLEFYYQKILHTKKMEATPDEVHLVFELAKNFVSGKVAAGTLVEAGKDKSGKKILYKTANEIIVNKARISDIKTVYHHQVLGILNADEKAGQPRNADGEKIDEPAKWWPFGYVNDPDFAVLPAANTGFAIASKLFELSSGIRVVTLSVQFEKTIQQFDSKVIAANLEVCCTGEKGWTDPLEILTQSTNESGKTFNTGIKSKGKQLDIAFLVPAEVKAIVPFNPKIHTGYYKPGIPVCRIQIKTGNANGYQLYSEFAQHKMVNVAIEVDVSGVQGFSLSNDYGKLDSNKPFYPFGTFPVRNASLNLGHEEIFSKPWKSLKFDVEWKNTPPKIEKSKRDSFADLYLHYRKSYVNNAKAQTYKSLSSSTADLIVENNSHFKAGLSVFCQQKWQTMKSEATLFNWKNGKFSMSETVLNNNSFSPDPDALVRLSLNQSFYHEMFPRIYALALSCNDNTVPLPNEPYTPLAEGVSVSYTATQQWLTNASESGFSFYHIHPFGQSIVLPQQIKTVGIVPEYNNGGQLYLGIADVLPRQQVSLLIQLNEGSENTETESFGIGEKVEWSVLCNNRWKILGPESIISDETRNFLSSGIVKIILPTESSDTNTLLPAGVFWLKASIQKAHDAVCKVAGISTQAVLAKFEDNNNDPSHLVTGLKENSVSKLAGKIPEIKSVVQPFSSFGGKAPENEPGYYQRVSERLRHKNRAIALWDYEHLILQNFTDIYKVRCLNHTKLEIVNGDESVSFLAPGNVLLVVIPDIQDKNVYDIFEPRLSKARLKEIETFINKSNSIHVRAKVVNPGYEKVTVSLKVKFRSGYDEIYYQQVLNEAIIKMLSPWAFDKTAALNFGSTLHRSVVINYIEKLEYVDYLADLTLKKGTENNLTNVTPDSPVSILVSSKMHDISLVKVK